MRASLCRLATSVALLGFVAAQSSDPRSQLSAALNGYPDLTLFQSLLSVAKDPFDQVVKSDTSDITVLVPTNEAIGKYLKKSGITNVTDLNAADLVTFFSYQIMAASLKGDDFKGSKGMVVPTFLKGAEYNNRSAGPELEKQYGDDRAAGQVLFASEKDPSTRRMKRQGAGPVVDIRAGLAQDAEMQTVDVAWGSDGVNTFQIVDSVLSPPRNCSTTIRSFPDLELKSLDDSLVKAQLWPTLDAAFNVTCLAPTTEAFKKAGDPQVTASKDEVSQLLLAHTLGEVTYSNFLTDGQVIGTLNNTKVTVHLKGNDIYFNNAKVIEANVLTNNGLLHVLDSVIKAEDDVSAKATGSSTSSASKPSSTSASGTASGTEAPSSTTASVATTSETNAASALAIGYTGVLAMAAGILLF
ncbi:FAS1 domain-containing protein [Dactylonectria estremocensis]|uniref:FAS1 domain-containing protein n=1 Tax=Dactylonectria estremocensis TaxID=1079267 RepID=A0A9P9DMQ2_9HYPO|nr:FAS1 domain-containing protein [Dactylonectria estremocensis]